LELPNLAELREEALAEKETNKISLLIMQLQMIREQLITQEQIRMQQTQQQQQQQQQEHQFLQREEQLLQVCSLILL